MKTLFALLLLASSAFCHETGPGPDHRPDRGPGPDRHGYGSVFIAPVRPIYPSTQYIPGHYEVRTETVLVQAEMIQKQWVAPVFETKYDGTGRPVVIQVAEGYYRDVVIPARYETRTYNIWVPGYFVPAPMIYEPRNQVDLFIGNRHGGISWGLDFRFSK